MDLIYDISIQYVKVYRPDSISINRSTFDHELTGGDHGPDGTTTITSVMSVNKLFNYDEMAEYTRPDRTR
jgi:hypothetical protein